MNNVSQLTDCLTPPQCVRGMQNAYICLTASLAWASATTSENGPRAAKTRREMVRPEGEGGGGGGGAERGRKRAAWQFRHHALAWVAETLQTVCVRRRCIYFSPALYSSYTLGQRPVGCRGKGLKAGQVRYISPVAPTDVQRRRRCTTAVSCGPVPLCLSRGPGPWSARAHDPPADDPPAGGQRTPARGGNILICI